MPLLPENQWVHDNCCMNYCIHCQLVCTIRVAFYPLSLLVWVIMVLRSKWCLHNPQMQAVTILTTAVHETSR